MTVDLVDLSGGTGDQRSSRVADGANTGLRGVASTNVLTADQHVVDVHGPVGLREEGSVGDLTSVLGVVNTTQDQLTTGAVVGVLGQPEGENVLVNELLVHDVVPDGGDGVDGDGLESKTEDTIELGSKEGDSRLGGGLSEGLVGDMEVRDVEDIGGKETRKTTSSVLDLKVLTIGRRGGGSSGVVLVVGLTSDVTTATGGGRDPKVGGTSVKDDSEWLGGGTELDGTIVLRVTQINKLNGVGVIRGLLHAIPVTDGIKTVRHLDVVLGGGHRDPDEVGTAGRHEKGKKEVLHDFSTQK